MIHFYWTSTIGKCCLVFLLLTSVHSLCHSQKVSQDSLMKILLNEEEDIGNRIKTGLALGKMRKYKKTALPIYHKTLVLAESVGDTQKTALVNWNIGQTFSQNALADSAKYYYDQALQLYLSLGNLKQGAVLYRNLGLQEFRQGNHKKALSNYHESLRICEVINNGQCLASSFNLIAGIHRNQKQYDEAADYYDKCIDISARDSLFSSLADAYGNKGILYQLQNNADKALDFFQKGLAVSRQHQLARRIPIFLLNVGILYEKKGEIEHASTYLEESNTLLTKQGRKRGTAQLKTALGRIAMAKNKPKLSIEYCREASRMAQQANNPKDLVDAYHCLKNAYKLNGEHRKALAYFELASNLKDSLFQESKIKEITELELKFQFEKKAAQINLEHEAESNRQKNTRNLLIFGILGISGIVFQLFRNAKAKKRINDQLLQKNQIITKTLKEKELLMKEIHHRVKNNLQVVSSLLGLQSEYIQDESALSAINDGRNRVRSMALIHQDLYKDNNLTGIHIKSYFEKLINGLFDSYNIDQDRIQLAFQVQDLNLDVDTVIPLGLITNELVSNALKHAFKNKATGTVQVLLNEEEGNLKLVVKDDGEGIDPSTLNENISSFGYQMIFAFKEKLNADLDIINDEGTTVSLKIQDYLVST